MTEEQGEFDREFLIKLAREKSVEGRNQLGRLMLSMFDNTGSELTDRERQLMFDILGGIVHEIEMSVRQNLAEKLADFDDAPVGLVSTLANDSIDVAYPILNRSGLLRDNELIEVIQRRTLEHQLAVAARKDVSEHVAAALVNTDDESVIIKLLHNENASISDSTMAYLVEQSERRDSFQDPLLHRDDLGEDLAKRMFLWVSVALREFIIESYEIDANTVDNLLEQAAIRELEAPAAKAKKGKKADELARILKEEGLVTPDMLVIALREGEVPLFIALFCRLTGLREVLASRILFEPGGEGLAIACKGIGISKPIFSSVFALSRRARAVDVSKVQTELAEVLKFYDRISEKGAAQVLSTWRLGSDYLGAIRQLQERIRRDE